MKNVRNIHDLVIYNQSLDLATEVIKFLGHPKLKHEYGICDQLKRSAASVASNISEGYGRNTRKDFAQFLSIALGSANESITYLEILNRAYTLDTRQIIEKYNYLTRRIFLFRKFLLTSNH
jgi:four helix bundle protein